MVTQPSDIPLKHLQHQHEQLLNKWSFYLILQQDMLSQRVSQRYNISYGKEVTHCYDGLNFQALVAVTDTTSSPNLQNPTLDCDKLMSC